MTRKVKSHSVRPVTNRPPVWLEYTREGIEGLVVKLAKEGNTSSNIGIILRDQYGIPLVKPSTGKTITKILEESKLASIIPEDLDNLLNKANRLTRHLEKNRSDASNLTQKS